MTTHPNPLGLRGIDFTEFCGPSTSDLEQLFLAFGFSRTKQHDAKRIACYQQNDITFLINDEQSGFSRAFAQTHGPAIASMGWRVDDAAYAHAEALPRGAAPDETKDLAYPAIYGIGDSLIYFIDRFGPKGTIYDTDFVPHANPLIQPDKGFLTVDHLTNNVHPGTMEQWADFYKGVFGFFEVRYFDIKGMKTGLTSYALRSPDGSFCIPINQPKSDKDQTAEYLRDDDGPGARVHLRLPRQGVLVRPVGHYGRPHRLRLSGGAPGESIPRGSGPSAR